MASKNVPNVYSFFSNMIKKEENLEKFSKYYFINKNIIPENFSGNLPNKNV